tara:strand:+ start:688 stop:990 length:303 start_codon:yes stop_codon:yes gene_type:complete
MPGYKMKNGSKDFMIKSYRDGGLVETKSYRDGKLVVAMAPVTDDSKIKMSAKDLVDRYGEDEARALLDTIKKSNENPNLSPEPLTRELENRAKSRDAKPK